MKNILLALLLAGIWSSFSAASAHDIHECPAGFPDSPILSGHIEQADIDAGRYGLEELFEAGRRVFTALFNICDGQGRPSTTGGGDHRDPGGQPAFIRTSSPDSNSCAGCHNVPRAGGSGDFVANVFVLAQTMNPVTFSVAAAQSNERNTLGMFGSGAIDMLAREMTADLLSQATGLADGQHTLKTKGVEFEISVSGGAVVASRGIDTDLIVKPFHQAGVVRSIREFTVNALNHHHGMQAEERFDLNSHKGNNADYDGDGVSRELTVGDVTALTIFQAALGVPGRMMPPTAEARDEVVRGERLFTEVGCASCHVPEMRLRSADYVEPYSLNPAGTFANAEKPFVFGMTQAGEGPHLEADGDGAIVRAYTDLKRHDLCDDPGDAGGIRFFCNEKLAQGRPDQDGRPGAEFFITRKLWDAGNSAPYGHRGDLTTITEAIVAHGGEARAARDAFASRPVEDQAAVVNFLKTLVVLPAGSTRLTFAPR